MKQKDLILGLIRYRFTQNGVRLGMSVGEAAKMAEERMRSEGLFGIFAGAKLIATPEGGIVSIVETFFKLYVPELKADPDFTKKRIPANESERRHRAILTRIFAAIENHRSRFYPGRADYPIDLKEYVAYRMEIEMTALHRIEASSMGLDPDTVHQMVDDAATFFKARLDQF